MKSVAFLVVCIVVLALRADAGIIPSPTVACVGYPWWLPPAIGTVEPTSPDHIVFADFADAVSLDSLAADINTLLLSGANADAFLAAAAATPPAAWTDPEGPIAGNPNDRARRFVLHMAWWNTSGGQAFRLAVYAQPIFCTR